MKKSIFLLAMLLVVVTAHSQNIYRNSAYRWKGNEFVQGSFRAKAESPTSIRSNYSDEWLTTAPNFMPGNVDAGIDRTHWTLRRDISHLPHYTSSLTIDNALFNMSLEESELAIEPDSTYRTGVYWGGVWTRDVSYSILHSLAQLCPEVSMRSLLAKVDANNRIIQDTGTGGAWPCSTDRTTWVLAAWEVYLVTGDKGWLERIFPVVRNTLEDDHIVAFDPATGLMRGETSWLDWREQEYPTWMQPADIYTSEAMNTTAVHYRALRILARMCAILNMPGSERYDGWAGMLRKGMNEHLWMEDKGLYAIYLYGRNHLVQHPQMEILGEAFAILWDIADSRQQQRISQSMVSEPFGTPDFFPNLSDQYPYHNNAMWPFTQGYWMKAQAKAGNEQGVLHAISSIYRLAAMTLTNLENMVIWSGAEKGLPINSPRQLWSVAADISIVPNIYFGMCYREDGIDFRPFVPKVLNAKRHLSNFRYRDAVLDISLAGYGNKVRTFRLDGIETLPFIPADLTGEHRIEIVLNNTVPSPPLQMVLRDNACQPLTPVTTLSAGTLAWKAVPDAVNYIVLHNGKELCHTDGLKVKLEEDGEYAVVAVDAEGWHSYMSEPCGYYSKQQIYEVELFAPIVQPDAHAAVITRNDNILIRIPFEVTEEGLYALDWHYANGNGPINTENKCATRLLSIDGHVVGASVFPQRGSGEWDNWGWSNAVCTRLNAGHHIVTLEFTPTVENMNLITNEARLDYLRVTRL
ncbi:MAG: hypothetical protein J6T94_08415 [Bacteroidaceae bacterium]|nr:hypothetical protein [Bacteroidaceae bacterium]